MVSCKWSVETTPLSRIVADTLSVKHLATPDIQVCRWHVIVIAASNVSARAAELDHVDRWAESNNLRLNRESRLKFYSQTVSVNPHSHSPSASVHIGHSCAITAWVTTRWDMFTRPSFSPSCFMLLQHGRDSPVRPINNVLRHQYGVLFVLACTRLMILRFLNWSQISMITYLQIFGTIPITFCTNFYLT